MTSRQYKHQQDKIQRGWSKVHVMLDPEDSEFLDFLCTRFGTSKTEGIARAIRCMYQDEQSR